MSAHKCKYLKISKKEIRSPEAGVRDSSETPDVGAGNSVWVLWKHTSNRWSNSPSPDSQVHVWNFYLNHSFMTNRREFWKLEATEKSMQWSWWKANGDLENRTRYTDRKILWDLSSHSFQPFTCRHWVLGVLCFSGKCKAYIQEPKIIPII